MGPRDHTQVPLPKQLNPQALPVTVEEWFIFFSVLDSAVDGTQALAVPAQDPELHPLSPSLQRKDASSEIPARGEKAPF